MVIDFEYEVKLRYPHFANDEVLVKSLVQKAKMFYYRGRYPSEPLANEETHPIIGFVGQTWVLSAVDELVERLGFNSAIGYKENGTTWSLDGAQLSERLLGVLIPNIGVIGE